MYLVPSLLTLITDRNPVEVVIGAMIYKRDSLLRLTRGRKGPTIDIKNGQREKAQPQPAKVEEGDKEEAPLVKRERRVSNPQKRK